MFARGRETANEAVEDDHLVVLVHGFFKGSADMSVLAQYLKKQGFSVLLADLPTTFADVAQCVAQLARQIDERVKHASRVSFVAHSLGGLIVRGYWQRVSLAQLDHCVFIATPHGGSRLAQVVHAVPGYSRLFKPVMALLPGGDYPRKPPGAFKLGLIAGTRNQGLGRWWLSRDSDGRVEVHSVASEDANSMLLLPYSHKVIHKQRRCLHAVEYFLRHGHFQSG